MLLDSAKAGELRFERAHWSLVPSWSKTLKLKYPTFNARAEGTTEKSTWRKSVQSHRAIILAEGFFEWTGERGSKTPWWMSYPDEGLMGFAGLYSWWCDPSKGDEDPDRWKLTATIVTSDALQTLGEFQGSCATRWLCGCVEGRPARMASSSMWVEGVRMTGALGAVRLATEDDELAAFCATQMWQVSTDANGAGCELTRRRARRACVHSENERLWLSV